MSEKPMSRPPAVSMTINHLVAYNLMRARRSAGLTQQEVAARLEGLTGRSWSNASVSAAERSWKGGRPRRFDANEICAFGMIFGKPLGYFFLAPDDAPVDLTVNMTQPEDAETTFLFGLATEFSFSHFLEMVIGTTPSEGYDERVAVNVQKFLEHGYEPPRLTIGLKFDDAPRGVGDQPGVWQEAAPDVAVQAYQTALLRVLAKAGAAEVLREAQREFEDRMGRLVEVDNARFDEIPEPGQKSSS